MAITVKKPTRMQGSNYLQEVDRVLSEIAAGGVAVEDRDEVRDYLMGCPDTLEVVEAACEETAKRFPKRMGLSLEVYHDPEVIDPHLTLYVRLDNYSGKSLRQIRTLASKYAHRLSDRSGWMVIFPDHRSRS